VLVDISKINPEGLNDTYYRIADLIGVDDAIRLSEAFAGQEVRFSKVYREDNIDSDYSELIDCIGKSNTIKMIKAFGGESVYFTSTKRMLKKQIHDEIRKRYTGYNDSDLSKKFGYTQRHIRRIVSEK